ncbi:MAG: ParA family protein [Planctomycetota bacterium]
MAPGTGPAGEQPTRVIAMMNQKGGVGKTTTTVSLAAAFARAGRRTLVIDLDPQAHASMHLGVEPSEDVGSIYDLIIGGEASRCAVEARENLWVVPGETDLAGAESELADASDRHARLRRGLDAMRGRFDFVLIDCPPSLGHLTLNGLVAAGEVIIPMQAHFLALQGVGKLLETVQIVRGGLNPRLTVSGVVLCMHDKQATHAQEVVEDIRNFFESAAEQPESPWHEARVFEPAIRRNIKLAECPSFGQTIFEYAPTAAGAEDYEALARAMLGAWDADLLRRGITPEIHIKSDATRASIEAAHVSLAAARAAMEAAHQSTGHSST